ncbi:MAG TPA: magnesium transporter [Oscillospiraceae bacterium]|nr:magnesium transporter [Oscillospiraceae bacterium]
MSVTINDTLEILLEQKKYNAIKTVLSTMNPSDIAALLEDVPPGELLLLFRLLPKELAADTFVEMDSEAQKALVQGFSDTELKSIVDDLYVDDAVDLVEEMPANLVKRILSQAEPDTRRLINEILKYPDDSAGSLMTTEYVDLNPGMTAGEAIGHIRATGVDKETVNLCYVVDDKRKLLGVVSLRSIILAKPDMPVSELMEQNVVSVTTHEDQELVAQTFAKYNFTALPVVDSEDRLVGIVTVDDAIDVMQEEASEDISKMAAVTPTGKPYLRLSVFDLWRSRIPWLLILMISATFTGMIITHFENALATYVVLTAFIPMLMDTGGNSGSQSTVTIIRSLSLGEIGTKDTMKILWKEIRVAVLCGLTLAIVNFGKLMLFDRVGFKVSLVVCITLVFDVLASKIVGALLPLGAEKVGLDPAVLASPVLTTIVDAVALLIYFTAATYILGL